MGCRERGRCSRCRRGELAERCYRRSRPAARTRHRRSNADAQGKSGQTDDKQTGPAGLGYKEAVVKTKKGEYLCRPYVQANLHMSFIAPVVSKRCWSGTKGS